MFIKNVLKKIKTIITQYKKYKFNIATKRIIYFFLTREKYKSFGKLNDNKTIYIIRSINDKSKFYTGPINNLLANYFYVLSHLCYAREKGWISVIDEENYPTYNQQEKIINGTKNAWEYYWEQPYISLKDAYNSKNVILSKQSWIPQWDMGYDINNHYNKTFIKKLHEIADTIPLNTETKRFIMEQKEKTFPKNKKILGVNLRFGGHSLKARYHGEGHPVQPQIEDLISLVRENMGKWRMDKVFLACEAEYAVKLFRYHFKEDLIVYNRQRVKIGAEYDADRDKSIYEKDNLFKTTLDYLTEMELLASCNALIGSITSGFRYAIVQNGNSYEHLLVLDCGCFPDLREKK